jgi:dolichol-phosphate mannosyltransferase
MEVLLLVTVVVPTYNECENIAPLLKQLANLVDEVIVVDDNSPDGTGLIARNFGRNVRTIIRPGRMGLNGAIVKGILEAKDDGVIVMDADFSHPPSVIPRIKEALRDHDIVIASRSRVIGWGFRRRLMSEAANFLARVLFFRWKIQDPMSGFFGIKRSVVEEYRDKISPRGYKVLFAIIRHYILEHDNNGIASVDYTFVNRTRGKSKLSAIEVMDYVKSFLKG